MTKTPWLVRLVTDVVAVALAFAAPATSLWCFSHLLTSLRASRWPPVEVRIKHAEVKSSGSSSHESYQPDIRYAYEVAGRQFESSSIEASPGATNSKDYAADLVRRFPAGGTATARYNPRDPAESYLLTGIRVRPLVGVIAPWLFFVLSVAWLRERLRGRRPAAEPDSRIL